MTTNLHWKDGERRIGGTLTLRTQQEDAPAKGIGHQKGCPGTQSDHLCLNTAETAATRQLKGAI